MNRAEAQMTSDVIEPSVRPGTGPAPADMIRVEGGMFRMGSDRHYPEEAPVHRVAVDGFWIDRTPVTNRQFKDFVRATGHVMIAEIVPKAEDYPGALPHMLKAGSLVFSPPTHPVDLADWSQWWSFIFRRELEEALRTGLVDQGPRRPSARARRLSRCRGLRGLGRQGASDRSRVGVRGPRRARGRRVRLGRRARARRAADGEHLAGRVPTRKRRTARLQAHYASRRLSAERLRPSRHDRQCLGMDHRLVRAKA